LPSIKPIHWKKLECIFLKAGFKFIREKSSHKTYFKKGCLRPVIIPKYDEVGRDIIMGLLRTSKMSRDEYFTFLGNC